MAEDPYVALDSIRNQLQVILLRSELVQSSGQCDSCTRAVCQIVEEIRSLEAFITKALHCQ